jgi:DNA-binding YbaB/EbfC family protein
MIQKMFKGLGQMASLMRQAQQIGGQMKEMNEKMAAERVVGAAGGGMIEVEANGLGEVLKVTIEPKLVADGEVEMIQDLLVAAINQASEKAKQVQGEQMGALTQGLDLGGLSELLGGQFPPS